MGVAHAGSRERQGGRSDRGARTGQLMAFWYLFAALYATLCAIAISVAGEADASVVIRQSRMARMSRARTEGCSRIYL